MTKMINKKILKAGAGTGKTYRLSLEYIANLIKGINYKNIVVMTFTKKATAEIKDRIYDFLYQIAFEKYKFEELEKSLKEIYGFKSDEIDKDRLQSIYFEMIKNKDEIRIYTIDGFTNRIFKNTIAPFFGIYGYETLEEEDDSFYEDILVRILNNNGYFEKFSFVFEEKKERKNINTYIDFIKNIIYMRKNFILAENYNENYKIERIKEFNTDIESMGFSDNSNNKNIKNNNIKFVENIEDIFSLIEKVSEIKNGNAGDYINSEFQNIYKEFKNIDEKISKDRIENKEEKLKLIDENWEIFFLSKNIWNGNKVRGKEVAEIVGELKELQDLFIRKLSDYIFSFHVLSLHNKIFDTANMIYDIAEQIKLSSKRFTYDDITTYTYKFIFNKELGFVKNDRVTDDFLELIGGNADTVMIDEFQDTSVLQWKILKLLLNSAKNIVCVGDEKQSIYSWRGGEKELFEKLEELIGGSSENLDKSYRSYKEIIENVNSIFENYNGEWSYNPVKYRDDVEYQKGYFSYHLQKRKTKYNNGEEKPEAAYEKMIRMIKDGKIQNLGNTCIICRKNKQLNEIAQRLNEENIPYTLNSSFLLLEHSVIKPLYKLIKYFVFNNYAYLLEFMRSDLIGCLNDHVKYMLENKSETEKYIKNGDDEKFSDFVNRQEEKIRNGLSEYKNIDKMERNGLVFSEILFKIKKLKNLSGDLNSKYQKENFSKKLMEEFYVLEFYSTNSDIKNIFKFFNILKEHNDLFEFVTYVEDEKEKLKQLSSGDEEAINLMTIHKSKGLEFDTVIYYENDTGITRENRDLIIYFDYDEKFEKVNNFLITFPKYNKIFIDDDYFRINEKNRKKEEMENINNDYVALTRAKKNLLLFMEAYTIKDKGKDSFKDSFIKRLIEIYNDEEYYSIGEITESRKERGKTQIGEYKEIDSIMSYFDDDILKKPVNNYKTDLEGEFRRKKGLAMHYYFEHMTNDYENDRKNAKSAFLSRYGNMLGKKLIEELLERMEKFILENKEIYDRKYKVYTEFEIYDSENNKRIIDRINIDEENGKIFIYDYKTGFEPTENEKYIQQLEEYKKILAEKTSGKYEIFTKILEV